MLGSVLICLVVSVADGDTLKVRCGEPGHHEQLSIRLSAIDAPEKAQPFGARSKQALSDLCFQQKALSEPSAPTATAAPWPTCSVAASMPARLR